MEGIGSGRDTVVANELDYKQYDYSHSSYQLTQIFQQIGLSTVTLGTSGGADSIFQIPACAFNLFQSFLNFTLTPPTSAGANNCNWVYVDGISAIRQLQLYTDNGLYLMDLYDVCNYTNMIFRYDTKFDDIISSDQAQSGVISTSANRQIGECEGLQIGAAPAGAIIAQPTGYNIPRPTGWSNNPTLATTVTNNSAFTNYYEPAYVLPGLVNSTSPVINFRIPLRKIKDTICGIDKTLYFGGHILYMRIVWNMTSKIGYNNVGAGASNTAFNPAFSLGGAGPSQNTPTAWTGNVTISNLYLYLAKERNIVVENSLKSKCSSADGFKLLVPWVSQFKQNVNSSQINNITMRFTNALGRRLLKILWASYNATESICYAYDHNILPTDANFQSVGNGAFATKQKISSFYTLVNNDRTSQFNYNCNNGNGFNTDYIARKNKIKGSSCLSQNEYYYSYVYEENFSDNVSKVDKPLHPDEDNYIDGIDISQGEVKYDIFITQSGTVDATGGNVDAAQYQNVNIYVYAVTLKELVINSSGISIS
jgi:hypothetical protein